MQLVQKLLIRLLKSDSTLKKLVQQQLMEQPNKKVPNWLLMKSTKLVVLMARNLKLLTRIINLKQQKQLLVTTNLVTQSKVNAVVGPATSGATAAAVLMRQKQVCL